MGFKFTNTSTSISSHMVPALQNARVFNQPVDTTVFHDYLNFVSRPMDFGTIKTTLENDGYATPAEFRADVEQVFANARLYNPPDSGIVQVAI